MKNRAFFLPLALVLASISGCQDYGNNPSSGSMIPSGSYVYSGCDSNGYAIVRGCLSLFPSDGGSVSGEWHFVPVHNRTDIGPQTGAGQLAGQVVDTMIYLNLNPGWIDNNVILSGELGAPSFHGRWDWVTFSGITNHGTFEAVKHRK